MQLTFTGYGTIPLEERPRSIFDQNIAGQFDTLGTYYVIHADHKTHKYYALTKENYFKFKAIGRILGENETAVFAGEKVRGMTFAEEQAWNEDRLAAHVDLWGNIAVDEPYIEKEGDV